MSDAAQPTGAEGAVPSLATPQERDAAMDRAFDYRGDVTIHTRDGRVIEGYIFDRRRDGDEPHVRILPGDGGERVSVRYSEIARLTFSGRDTAAGKSWETWLRKYAQSKRRGEAAQLEPEKLD